MTENMKKLVIWQTIYTVIFLIMGVLLIYCNNNTEMLNQWDVDVIARIASTVVLIGMGILSFTEKKLSVFITAMAAQVPFFHYYIYGPGFSLMTAIFMLWLAYLTIKVQIKNDNLPIGQAVISCICEYAIIIGGMILYAKFFLN